VQRSPIGLQSHPKDRRGSRETSSHGVAREYARFPLLRHPLENALKQHRDGLDMVFVDYLQQLFPGRRTMGEFETVTAVTRELDAMSMKYGLPFVVASQFSRNAEGQQPSMADLRSSGQIEQAADVIISLWTKAEEATNPNRAKVYFDVLKNRNGFTLHNTAGRQYALMLDKPCFTFREITTRDWDAPA